MSRAYTAFAIQDMARIPEGMEVAWQRVRVYDPQSRTVLEESETGQMDNHMYQRAARPWTWLGPEEPYIYESSFETDVLPTGETIELYRITRKPNTAPVLDNSVNDNKCPYVESNLGKFSFLDEMGRELIAVELLVKGVPKYNRPLRPRMDAPLAEQEHVLASQVEYDHSREQQVHWLATPVIADLEEMGASEISLDAVNGWISATIPLDSLGTIESDTRIKTILSANVDSVENECIPEPLCKFTSSSNVVVADEWLLGDGVRTQRLDAQQFYDMGCDGSYNQGPHNSLVAGIMELGRYEDEAFFDKNSNGTSRMIRKYQCDTDSSCPLLANNNFNDTEVDCNTTNPGTPEYWAAGCHGTGVASILMGRNFHNSRIDKRHITSRNASVQLVFYRSDRLDRQNSQN